jgi:4-aminobutyrate aminotransferase-like enzyme
MVGTEPQIIKPGFYKKAYEITKSFGGVNIMDEVQSGFGRLGTHYWGFEYHDVRPDIITAAKSESRIFNFVDRQDPPTPVFSF